MGASSSEARHRAHARVEDRIRCGKDTGIGRYPSRELAINAAWQEAALTAMDLIAWTQTILLHGELAKAEPKKLRPGHPPSAPRGPACCDGATTRGPSAQGAIAAYPGGAA